MCEEIVYWRERGANGLGHRVVNKVTRVSAVSKR